MDHTFSPSQLDTTKCIKCKQGVLQHTNFATCDACPKVGAVEMWCDMALCPDCYKREKDLQDSLTKENMTPAKQEERVKNGTETALGNQAVLKIANILDTSRSIDQTVQIRTDLFNAATVAINELRDAINSDVSIENKDYKLAEVLLERFNHFKSVIFEMSQEIVEKQNSQRAIQSYLNTLTNKLRAEEREKLKLQDINYSPEKPKEIKPRLKPSSKKKSYDQAEVRKVAEEIGLPEIVVQMTCVQRNLNPQQAGEFLKNRKQDIGM